MSNHNIFTKIRNNLVVIGFLATMGITGYGSIKLGLYVKRIMSSHEKNLSVEMEDYLYNKELEEKRKATNT
ncbi:Hypothetical protein SRAE_2000325200 [Strongyloides ratti]|uniref:Cytochrome c oxidase assembly protein COX16 homolog, mitochondrial n=1 Tax=Strongyloides ratti TaxID=34506 RepID=A0A090LFM9_STRRB|nr:Hypothetical protein SRAE_2000325200 [Strongyloides ratti]CEF68596.1 Hypothetical protein SRAE_2000325200 [Strongyloides ratti]